MVQEYPVQAVVWVANRQAPIQNFSTSLQINSSTGNVLLVSKNSTVIWSAVPSRIAQNPVLHLLDTGNLVLRDKNDNNPENYLWQSFHHPTDTLLPFMKIGKDFRTGIGRRLTAWTNPNDPSPGNLSWAMHFVNYPEPILWIGPNKYVRGGPWNGVADSGQPVYHLPHSLFDFFNVDNENESYFSYYVNYPSAITRIIINQTTLAIEPYVWLEAEQTWKLYIHLPRDYCDFYGHCGPNGICNFERSPASCRCLNGYKTKSPETWKTMKYSEGCIRDTPLTCHGDEFFKQQKFKLPDTTYTWLDKNMTLNECRAKCLSNCSCMAYTNSDIRGGGSGCAIWFGDLTDIRVQPDGGQDLYVRIPASVSDKSHTQKMKVAIAGFTVSGICGLLIAAYGIYRIRDNLRGSLPKNCTELKTANEGDHDDLDVPLFELSKITTATGNFSLQNKLGQGGFGTVYKGTLKDGQEIAVKRLSRSSRQGIDEFKNEVRLIAKLQHRNLVRLVGCCMQDEEKLLIYEFMPNKSLDSFLFDEARGKMLDWSKRFHIICGIARGLLYLHQDSRLRIIHRDLKASNILLDSEMNPKISDFGLARCFGGEDNSRNTNRVVGTHGYMAPEYAINGRFSVKSDVFSFGVLVLEIVTGKKSRGLYSPTTTRNLIAHAWDFWKEGKLLGLIDERIAGERCNISEAVRCIHICLLCVQLNPEDRPSMSSILLVLDDKSCLPEPKEPGFFLGEPSDDGSTYRSSFNGLSVSEMEAR